MKRSLFALFAVLFLVSCERATKPPENAQYYETRGIVRGFSPDRATVEIEHETIRDFMPSMTMPFVPHTPKEIADLKLGDAIAFRLIVTPKDFWIDQIRKVRREEVNVSEPEVQRTLRDRSPRLKEGDTMPAFSLTNQEGKAITAETFRGEPLVLTFIFTRCPMPNFCPRMTNNFSELQKLIKAGEGPVARTRLLSITLDPGFDTPQILNQYGAHSNEDPSVWSLATGSSKEVDALTAAFSVYRQTEGGTLSHGLATALVSPDGKVVKIWRGNGWTPNEVISEVRAHQF